MQGLLPACAAGPTGESGSLVPTLEVRWFFRGPIPGVVLSWFQRGQRHPAGPEARVDYYLGIASDDSLGIKLREGRIEVKQRQRQVGPATLHAQVAGVVEHWRKWGFALTAGFTGKPLPGWVAVRKQRRLSRYRITGSGSLVPMSPFQYPAEGCDLELTSVHALGGDWWTLGFEAFGTEASLQEHLSLAAGELLAVDPPNLPLRCSYGYPRWLQLLAQREGR